MEKINTRGEKMNVSFFACFDHKTAFTAEKTSFDSYVLFAVKHGSIQYQIDDGNRYTAKENSIVVFPPNVPIFKEILEPTSFVMAKLNGQTDFVCPQEPFVLTDSSRIQEDISALSQKGFAFTHNPDAETVHYILDLWFLLAESVEKKTTPLQSAYDYICSHFCEDISIQALAESYGFTPPRFIAIFNKHYGAPPKNIILQRRILKAQQLLLQTDLSVGEISTECGYDDALYFSRIFSKYCGLSPAQFRKSENI